MLLSIEHKRKIFCASRIVDVGCIRATREVVEPNVFRVHIATAEAQAICLGELREAKFTADDADSAGADVAAERTAMRVQEGVDWAHRVVVVIIRKTTVDVLGVPRSSIDDPPFQCSSVAGHHDIVVVVAALVQVAVAGIGLAFLDRNCIGRASKTDEIHRKCNKLGHT